MKKVPYYNAGETVAHIDGKAIRPCDTRDVDPTQIPGYISPDKAAAAEPDDPLQTLLAAKVPEIVATLPGMSDEDYAALKQAEEGAGKPRKGLVNAFAEEDLRRADAAASTGPEDPKPDGTGETEGPGDAEPSPGAE